MEINIIMGLRLLNTDEDFDENPYLGLGFISKKKELLQGGREGGRKEKKK